MLLGLGLLVTWLTEPSVRNPLPIVYWSIDPAPARADQIHGFHIWQIRQAHGERLELASLDQVEAFRKRGWSPAVRKALIEANPRGNRLFADDLAPVELPLVVQLPACEMRLDAANNDLSKKLIQGVSTVSPRFCDESPPVDHGSEWPSAVG